MAVDVRASPGPERTRALLEEIAGGRRGAQLRGQVAARNRGATREHVEEAFQEACLKAGRSCRGQTMGEVYKWLLKTTDSTVRDMRERLKREVLIDQSATEFQKPDPSLAPPDEVLIKREEHAELSHLTISILERLGDRERKVAVLHSHGLARKEIARHLGTTSRIVKRDIEGILATGRAQLTKVTGRGCPDGDNLVARYAFGLATEREARRAQLHLASCTRCGSMFERLDLWRERVAALLPVPPAVDAQTHFAERIAHVGSDVLVSGHAQARPAGVAPARRACDGESAGSGREHVLPDGRPDAACGRASRRRGRSGRRLSGRGEQCDVLRPTERGPDRRVHWSRANLASRAQVETPRKASPSGPGRDAARDDADRHSFTSSAGADSDSRRAAATGCDCNIVGATARAGGPVRADVDEHR